MKYSVWYLSLLWLCVACGGAVQKTAETYDTLYAPTYARHFVVLTRGDSVFLRVNDPWQGASGVWHDYSLDKVPQKMVCMSSSHTAFLDTLGVGSVVVGVSSSAYFTHPHYAALPDVGYDQGLNVELVASLAPDVITAYEISGENASAVDRVRPFGVEPIYVADYLEESPLARAEWVVAFGALMGVQERGEEIFRGVEQKYNAIKDSVARSGAVRKTVMLNSPYKGVWYLPGDSTFVVRLLGDAGGEYAAAGYADNVSHAVSTEVAYAHLLRADVWLNPSAHINSRAALAGESSLLGRVTIPVFNTTARTSPAGGSDFWESGVVRADVVLADLVRILHPELLPEHKLYYYKEIK